MDKVPTFQQGKMDTRTPTINKGNGSGQNRKTVRPVGDLAAEPAISKVPGQDPGSDGPGRISRPGIKIIKPKTVSTPTTDNDFQEVPDPGAIEISVVPTSAETDPSSPASKTGSKAKKKKKGPWKVNWRIKLVSFLFAAMIAPVVVVAVTYLYFIQELPSTHSLLNYRPKTVSYAYADDGQIIGEFFEEHRVVVPLDDIPRHVIAAFVAAEDSNFFDHPGLDLIGIVRAMLVNMKAGRIVQGGSTITQQVTRSFLLSNEKTYERKIREALLAFRIEQNLTKEQILFLYLNQIYLGRGAYGVESAAQLYFGKHVSELTIAEAAVIAGLVRAPGRYSPFRTPAVARSRQVYVINRMLESGFITPEDGAIALEEKLVYTRRPSVNLELTPQFTEIVRRQVEDAFGADRLNTEGLRIYATVNVQAQNLAQESINKGLADLTRRQGYHGPRQHLNDQDLHFFVTHMAREQASRPLLEGRETLAVVTKVIPIKNQLEVRVGNEIGRIETKALAWALLGRAINVVFSPGDLIRVRAIGRDPADAKTWLMSLEPDPDTEAALVCLDTATGAVKAAVGGRDFHTSQFNRAVQARRQPGSAFKPFVYAAAMDSGYTQASIVNDIAVEYKDPSGTWTPKNYGGGHAGPMTLYDALCRSVNVVAVRLIEKIGPPKVVDYARRMGIKSPLGPYLSLALGASEVTLLEMVGAFTTFPNLGMRVEPRFVDRITDRDGKVIHQFKPQKVEALSPETSYIVLDMLRGVVQRGTGATVNALGRPVAGKTGTTNDQADAWFVGFTPDYACGVWVGRDQRKSLGYGEQGGRTAAPIFLSYMKEFMKDKPVRDFAVPPGVVRGLKVASENGEATYLGFVFKKGQQGRGISEEPESPDGEETAKNEKSLEAPDPVKERMERMRKYLENYKTGPG